MLIRGIRKAMDKEGIATKTFRFEYREYNKWVKFPHI